MNRWPAKCKCSTWLGTLSSNWRTRCSTRRKWSTCNGSTCRKVGALHRGSSSRLFISVLPAWKPPSLERFSLIFALLKHLIISGMAGSFSFSLQNFWTRPLFEEDFGLSRVKKHSRVSIEAGLIKANSFPSNDLEQPSNRTHFLKLPSFSSPRCTATDRQPNLLQTEQPRRTGSFSESSHRRA